MFDDKGNPEVIEEPIEAKIARLFDELEFKIADLELNQQAEEQRKFAIEALREIPVDVISSPKSAEETAKYAQILEMASGQIQGDKAVLMIAQLRVNMSLTKIHYEAGRIRVAFEIIDGEDGNEENGTLISAYNNENDSPDSKIFYGKLKQLDDLLYQLLKEQLNPTS